MSIALGTATDERDGSTAYHGSVRSRPLADVRSMVADLIEIETKSWPASQYQTNHVAFVDWRHAVEDAEDVRSLIALLRLAGLTEIADRIASLSKPGEDLEDDEEPASIESIRALALSIRALIGLGEPLIGLMSKGALVAEWLLAPDKHLAMKFVDEARVTFALIAPAKGGPDRARLNGTSSGAEALAAIGAYGVYRWREYEG